MNQLEAVLYEEDTNYVEIKEEDPEYVITLVPANYINTVWQESKPHLEKAVIKSGGRWEIESVYQALLKDEQQLWITMNRDDKILGIATTQFVRYPNSLMCAIQYIGGDEFKEWAFMLGMKLEAWAKDSGCDGIEGTARFGFWKWLSRLGWRKAYTVFEKRFNYE